VKKSLLAGLSHAKIPLLSSSIHPADIILLRCVYRASVFLTSVKGKLAAEAEFQKPNNTMMERRIRRMEEL
jgi:hypothetical protein